jgi:hypothetical protein
VSNPSPGVLRVGGFTVVNPVAAGATGDAVYLTFIVACEDCTNMKLELIELKDDISTWGKSGGCFLACCRCNGDGECTPVDALCIFQEYLQLPSCLD